MYKRTDFCYKRIVFFIRESYLLTKGLLLMPWFMAHETFDTPWLTNVNTHLLFMNLLFVFFSRFCRAKFLRLLTFIHVGREEKCLQQFMVSYSHQSKVVQFSFRWPVFCSSKRLFFRSVRRLYNKNDL